jgi:hypothetical protein
LIARDFAADQAGVNAEELGRQKINNNNSPWAPRSARNHFAASMQAVAYRQGYGTTGIWQMSALADPCPRGDVPPFGDQFASMLESRHPRAPLNIRLRRRFLKKSQWPWPNP